jgi:uroporphyrinogen-III synthase
LSTPLYVVGPATSRTLTGLRDTFLPNCDVLGQDTGNGEKLAQFILSHYNGAHSNTSTCKLPLLFLVGEQRRDIIPKTLMSEELPKKERIHVDELVLYETVEMASFPEDFETVMNEARTTTGAGGVIWLVVFSPTGCGALLKGLQWIDEETGRYKGKTDDNNVLVATIGPTTRDYLKTTFGFEADVCAEKPSPEGVWEGIIKFTNQKAVR